MSGEKECLSQRNFNSGSKMALSIKPEVLTISSARRPNHHSHYSLIIIVTLLISLQPRYDIFDLVLLERFLLFYPNFE